MTVIVGVKTPRGVLLGADSQATAGRVARDRRDVKAFNISRHLAVAYCGSFRMGQLLRFYADPHQLDVEEVGDPFAWAVKTFIPHAREILKEHAFTKVDSNVESIEGDFLLAVRDRLFTVEADWQVAETAEEYTASGCGWTFALGALHATEGAKLTPRRRLTVAMDAACAFDAFCGGPYTFAETRA